MTQQETKSIIEKIFNIVNEEDKQSLLGFIEYIKSKKMTISGGKVTYKGKRIAGFGIFNDNVFQLSIQTQFDENFNDLVLKQSIEIKNLVSDQTGYTGCGRCITGKCSCTHINIVKPNKAMFSFAQELLNLRIEAILNEQVPKCNYIKISERGKIKKCAKCKVCNPACRKLKNF